MGPIRQTGLLLFVLSAALSVAGPVHPGHAAGQTGYRIATVAWAGWSPLHVADEQGFWRQLGLEVEVVDYDDPIIILEAMEAGRVDFAMDMAGTLAGIYMEGAPAVALAETNWSHGADRIIIRPGQSPQDHLGGPLGVFLDRPSCLYFLGLFLKTRNLRVSDYRIVEINPEDMGAQFAAGRLPLILSYDPWALKAVHQENGVCLATSADFEGCIPECLWTYAGRLQEIPPNDLSGLLRGWIRAVRWMNDPDHWPELKEILDRRTYRNQPPYTDEELKRLLAGVKIHTPAEMLERNKSEGGLYAYFRALRAFLHGENRLQRPFEVEDLFDNRFVLKALRLEGDEPSAD